MTTTISDGITVVTPLLVLGWQTAREARTRVHALVGSPYPDVTLRPSAGRAGTLSILSADQADAAAVEALHAAGVPLTLVDDVDPWANLVYVVAGPIVSTLDEVTRYRWVTTVDYAETAPWVAPEVEEGSSSS